MRSKTDYEVVVGNIGVVHSGHNKKIALAVFREYKAQSANGYGRAAGEPVALMQDGSIVAEWAGSLGDDMDLLRCEEVE